MNKVFFIKIDKILNENQTKLKTQTFFYFILLIFIVSKTILKSSYIFNILHYTGSYNFNKYISNSALESALLCILTLNLLLLAYPVFIPTVSQSLNMTTTNSYFGLELLRFALYDYTGAFLLLSTLVLLISLIGVAVITRNKK